MKKIKHIDFRQLKDEFFDDVDNDDALTDKAILTALYEYTDEGISVTEKELQELVSEYSMAIVFEEMARKGNFDVKYDKYGFPESAKLTDQGEKVAVKMLGELTTG